MRKNVISPNLPFAAGRGQDHKRPKQLRLVMKMAATLLLVACLGARANGYSQVTLHDSTNHIFHLSYGFKDPFTRDSSVVSKTMTRID